MFGKTTRSEDRPHDGVTAVNALLTLWRKSGQIPDLAELRRIWELLYLGLLKVLRGYGAMPTQTVVLGFNAPLQSFARAYLSVMGPLAEVGETDLARVAEREVVMVWDHIAETSP